MMKKTVVLVGILVTLSFAANGDDGLATFNTIWIPSSCFGFEDKGPMIAAASSALWDDKAACGRSYEVTCSGATNEGVTAPCRSGSSVVVQIVDFCPPPGCRGTLDLSQEAFEMIADPDAGNIQIEYHQVGI